MFSLAFAIAVLIAPIEFISEGIKPLASILVFFISSLLAVGLFYMDGLLRVRPKPSIERHAWIWKLSAACAYSTIPRLLYYYLGLALDPCLSNHSEFAKNHFAVTVFLIGLGTACLAWGYYSGGSRCMGLNTIRLGLTP